jgi:hypothetical protein
MEGVCRCFLDNRLCFGEISGRGTCMGIFKSARMDKNIGGWSKMEFIMGTAS